MGHRSLHDLTENQTASALGGRKKEMKKEMVDAMKTISEHMEVRKQKGWSLQGVKETKEKMNKRHRLTVELL